MKKRGRMDEGDEGNFTWTWAGETFTFPNSGPSGFEWRDNSNWHQNKKFYNESDVEDECQERSNAADLMIHRATLGLPRTGPLILDHIKSAYDSVCLYIYLMCHIFQGKLYLIHFNWAGWKPFSIGLI